MSSSLSRSTRWDDGCPRHPHRRRGGEPRVWGSTAVDAIRHMGGGDAGRMIRSVNSLRDVGLDSRRDGHGIKVGSLELAIGDLF